MCKLSLNIVQNVYNSLQSSFLLLAWPWPGRSLPKGNQWEWWDPQQGPLPGLGEVGHSPRECWDPGLEPNVVRLPVHLPPPMQLLHPQWLPMPLWHPLHPYFPNATYTPVGPSIYTPYQPPNAPLASLHPQCLLMPPIPILAPEHLHTLPASMHPWHPLHPLMPHTPLGAPNFPWCCPYPCWPLSTYIPRQPLDTPTPLLVEASSGQQWYYCRSA